MLGAEPAGAGRSFGFSVAAGPPGLAPPTAPGFPDPPPGDVPPGDPPPGDVPPGDTPPGVPGIPGLPGVPMVPTGGGVPTGDKGCPGGSVVGVGLAVVLEGAATGGGRTTGASVLLLGGLGAPALLGVPAGAGGGRNPGGVSAAGEGFSGGFGALGAPAGGGLAVPEPAGGGGGPAPGVSDCGPLPVGGEPGRRGGGGGCSRFCSSIPGRQSRKQSMKMVSRQVRSTSRAGGAMVPAWSAAGGGGGGAGAAAESTGICCAVTRSGAKSSGRSKSQSNAARISDRPR